MRHALVAGNGTALEPLLVGGGDGRMRLAIHQPHSAASLVMALVERFPATVWLVGSADVGTPCPGDGAQAAPRALVCLPPLEFSGRRWHRRRHEEE